MKKKLLAITSLVLCGGFALVASSADARTHAAMWGKSNIQNTDSCFTWSSAAANPGLIYNCADFGSWFMSIIWDTPTSAGNPKTVSVTARQTAVGQVDCAAVTHTAGGLIAETDFFPDFAGAGYSTRSVSMTNVPAGSTTVVQCLQFPGAARILTLGYLPP